MSLSHRISGILLALASFAPMSVDAAGTQGLHHCVEPLDVARLAALPADAKATTGFRDMGNVAVVEYGGAYDRGLSEARAQVARYFYQHHADDYDFLIVFTTFEFPTGDALAFYNPVRNDVRGIGSAVYDHSQAMGSGGRLQGYIDMAALARYDFNARNPAFAAPLNTLAHEIMHRWGVQIRFRDTDGSDSTALLGRDGAHWSLLADTDASVMYGARWEETAPGQFRVSEARARFSPWDLYLAGFADPSEVPPMGLVQGSMLDPTDLPVVGTETNGNVRTVPLQAAIEAEGPRVPAADRSQRRFNAALVLVTRPGESVDPAVVVQLERFRLAFESYFQSITAGRASLSIGKLGSTDAPVAAPAPLMGSAAPPPADPVSSAIAWLVARQRPDGRWEDRPGTSVRDTAIALAAIAQVVPGHPALDAGRTWLGTREPRHADDAAWRLFGNSVAPSPPDLALLEPARDGGIGIRPGWQPALLDTSLALRADAERDLLDPLFRSRLANFLALVQNEDGGFGHTVAGPSTARVSTFVARALLRASSPEHVIAGNRARDWLLQRLGAGMDTPIGESAELLLHAGVLDLPAIPRANLLAGLLAGQGSAGDWGGSVYVTAASVLGLALQTQPNYALSEARALPAAPILGAPVMLRVRVRNNGGQPIPANTLQWFLHAAPDAGGVPLGTPYPVPALLAGETLVANVRVEAADIGQATTLVAAIDVDNTVVEASESDNTAVLDIAVAPPHAGVDAALYATDIVLSASTVTHLGQRIEVSGVVRNLGSEAMPVLPLALYRRTGDAREPLADTMVAVPASATATFALAFDVTELVPHRLELVADPHDAVAEADETNNTLALELPYGEGVDLLLGDEDLSFVPEHPAYGDDVRIRATVRNRGAGDSPATQLVLERDTAGQWQRLLSLPLAVPAGTASEREFLWRPDRAGTHALRVVADPDDVVAELDETNNIAALTVEVAHGDEPNLVVELGSILFDPDPPREGRPLAMLATVRNLGRDDAEAFNVGLYLDDPRTGGLRLGVTRLMEGLAGDASAQVRIDVPDYPAWGDAALYVFADSDGEIVERNEDDNLGIRETTALKLGDLAVAPGGIQVEPGSPVFGVQVRATVEVSNTGEQPTLPVPARLFERGPQESVEVMPALTVPGLEPGATHLLEWSWIFGQVLGADLLTVSIDPDNLEREHQETNNEATLLLSTQSGDAFVSERYFSPNGDGVRDRTTAWFVLSPETIATVLVQDVRGYQIADLRERLVAYADRVSATWDGRSDAGNIAPDGRYVLLARRNDGGIAARVEVELDTDRPMALEAVHTDRAVLRNLPSSANPWHRPPEGSVGEEYVYAVGSDANEAEARKRGVFRSHVLMGGLEQVVSRRWLDRHAAANGLGSIDVQELAFAPHTGDLWLLMREQPVAGPVRLALWSQAPLSTDSLSRIVELPSSAGHAPTFLGAFDTQRAVIGSAESHRERWVADFAAGSVVLLRHGSPDEAVLRVYPEGVVLGGSIPTTFVPADVAQPIVGLQIEAPWDACLSRIQFQPVAPRLLLHIQHSGKEHVDLIDLRTNDHRRLVEVHTGSGTCGGMMRADAIDDSVGTTSDADPSLADAGVHGVELSRGQNVALLRAYWLETQSQAWVQDHAAGLMRRFTASGGPLQSVPLPTTGLVGGYTNYGSYANPQPLAGEVVSPDHTCPETITPPWRMLAAQDRFERATFDPVAGEFYIAHGEAVLSHYPVGSSGSLYPAYCEGAVGFWRISSAGEVGSHGGLTRWPLAEAADRQRYPAAQVDTASGTILPPESWPQFIHANGAALRRDGRVQQIGGALTRPWTHAARVLRPWPSESRLELGTPGDWNRFEAVFSTLDRMSVVLRASSDGRAVHLSGLATDRNFERFSIDYAHAYAPDDWLALIPATREEVVFDDFITWAPPEPGAYVFRLTVVDRAGNRTSRYASAEVHIGSPIVKLIQNHRAISPNGDGVQDALELSFDVVRATEQRFRVVDEAARIVFEQDLAYGAAELGPQIWAWDGRDTLGFMVPDGRYWVELSAGFRIGVLVDTRPPTLEASISPIYPPVDYGIAYCADDHYGHRRSTSLDVLAQRRRVGDTEWTDVSRLERCDPVDLPSRTLLLDRPDRLQHQYRIVARDPAGNSVVVPLDPPDPAFFLLAADDGTQTPRFWQQAPFDTTANPTIPIHGEQLKWQPFSPFVETIVFPGPDISVRFAATAIDAATEVLVDVAVVDPGQPSLEWRTLLDAIPVPIGEGLYEVRGDFSLYERKYVAVRLRMHGGSETRVSNAFQFRVGGGSVGASFSPGKCLVSAEALLSTPQSNPNIVLNTGQVVSPRPGQESPDARPAKYTFEADGIWNEADCSGEFNVTSAPGRGSLQGQVFSLPFSVPEEGEGEGDISWAQLAVYPVIAEECNALPTESVRAVVTTTVDHASAFTLSLLDPRQEAPVLLAEGTIGDIPEDGIVFSTAGLPEGETQVVLRYRRPDDREGSIAAYFPVDRTPPFVLLHEPLTGARICPGTSGHGHVHGEVFTDTRLEWLSELAHGTGSPLLFEKLDCSYWRNSRDECHPLEELQKRPESVSHLDRVGQIQASAIEDDGPARIRLRAYDWSGAQVCSTVDVDVDVNAQLSERQPPEPVIAGVSNPQRVAVSADADAEHRIARWFLLARESLEVTADIYRARRVDSRYEIMGDPLLRFMHEPSVSGAIDPTWDATGSDLEDGLYGVAFTATDDCGNTKRIVRFLTLDSAPPEFDIHHPAERAELRVATVEVAGSVRDAHLLNYQIAIGTSLDGPWLELVESQVPVPNPRVLAQWQTFGAVGAHFLRFTAIDKLGNRIEQIRSFVLLERPVVMDGARMRPPLFSPNDDGVLDLAEVEILLRRAASLRIALVDAGGATLRVLADGLQANSGTVRVPWGGELAGGPASDGEYRVLIAATDAEIAGNGDELELTVGVDATPPEISSIVPSSAFATCDGVVSFVVEDSNLVAYDALLLNQAGHQVGGTAGHMSGSVDVLGLDTLSEGRYRLEIRALDAAGNRSEDIREFALDCTPPAIALTAPGDGAILAGTPGSAVDIAGSVADPNLVSWRLEAIPVASPAGTILLAEGAEPVGAGPLHRWELQVPDGDYWLRLGAVDAAGNESASEIVATVDGTPPEAAILSPEDGEETGSVWLSGIADDANFVQYRIDVATPQDAAAGAWSTVFVGDSPVRDNSLANFQLAMQGEVRVRLVVTDAVGLESVDEIRLIVNTVPPPVPVALIAQIEDGTNVRLAWQGGNAPDLAGFHVYREGEYLFDDPVTGRAAVDVDVAEGVWNYVVTAIDHVGNESEPSNIATVRMDRTPPDVAILRPGAGERVRGEVEVFGIAHSEDDFAWFELSLVDPDTGTTNLLRRGEAPVRNGLLHRWDTRTFAEGTPLRLRLVSADRTGNTAQHEVQVVVDNLPPAAPIGLTATLQSPDVQVTWDPNTEPDLLGYLLYRNGSLVDFGGSLPADLRPLAIPDNAYLDQEPPDGELVYRVYAIDLAGNVSPPSAPASVVRDEDPPHVEIVRPQEGLVFEEAIEVAANSQERDIAQVRFAWRAVGDTAWTDLGAPLAERPWRTTFDPEGLDYGHYELTAIATDQGGLTDPQPQIVRIEYADLTPPAPPAGLVARADGGTVTAQWNENAEEDLAGYLLERLQPDGAWQRLHAEPVAEPSLTDTGRALGAHVYRILAQDVSGNVSVPSEESTAHVFVPEIEPAPFTPTADDVATLAGFGGTRAGEAEVSIQSPAGTRELTPGPVPAHAAFAFEALALDPGRNEITLRIRDADGNRSLPAATSLTRGLVPETPGQLDGSVENGTVTLAWSPSASDDVAGYRVHRDGVALQDDAPLPQALAATSAGAPVPGAVDGDPSTVWRLHAAALDDALHGALELEWAVPALTGTVRVQWLDAQSSARDFDLDGWYDGRWNRIASVRDNAGALSLLRLSDAYPTDRLRLRPLRAQRYGGEAALVEIAVRERTFVAGVSHADAPSEGRHEYTVAALSTLGFEGARSAPWIAEIGDAQAPGPVVLSGILDGRDAVLDWTESTAPDLSHYELSRDGVRIAQVAAGQPRSFRDPSLPNGTHRYVVRAVDHVGNRSEASNQVELTLGGDVPGKPAILRILSQPGQPALRIEWAAGAGPAPVSYRLFHSHDESGDTDPYRELAEVADTAYLHTGLAYGERVYYRVQALDASGNASEPSDPAWGEVRNVDTPATPSLTWPTVPGRPVAWRAGTFDACGIAEPGTIVRVSVNGVETASQAPVTADTSIRSLQNEGHVYDRRLTPDGRHVLETLIYSGRLIPAEGGEPVPVDRMYYGWSELAFNATGNRLYGLNFYGQAVVWRRDQGMFDTVSMPVNAIRRLAISPDEDTALVVGNNGGSPTLWRVDRAAYQAEHIPLDQAIDIVGLRFTPDGQGAWAQRGSSALYRIDPEALSAAPVLEGRDLRGIIDVAIADGSALYVDRASGVDHVRTVSLAGSEREITTRTHEVHAVAWSPDAGRVALLLHDRIDIVDATTGALESSIPFHLYAFDAGYRLQWSGSWHLLVHRPDASHASGYLVDPAGRFCARNIPAAPGLNRVDAVAMRPSGVRSQRSVPIELHIGADPNLPDLSISPDDIRFVPAAGEPGRDYGAVVTVRSLFPSNSYHYGVAGRALLIAPDGSHRELPGFAQLGDFGYWNPVRAFSLPLGTLHQPGDYRLQIELDPVNTLIESDENNNVAIATLRLSEVGSVELSLGADSTTAAPGTAFGGHVTVAGATGFVGELRLRVLDAAGAPVADLLREAAGPLQFAVPWSRRWTWLPEAGLFADTYRLEAQLFDAGGALVDTRALPLQLQANSELRLHLQPATPLATIGEPLAVQFGLDYLAGNQVLADASLHLSAIDAGGGETPLWQGAAGLLMPGYTLRRNAAWATTAAAPGTARLRLRLQAAGIEQAVEREIVLSQAPPAIRLAGTLALAPSPRMVLGESAPQLDYRVENAGEVAFASVHARVVLREEGGSEPLLSEQAQGALAPGQALHGNVPLDPLPQRPQGYFAVLEAHTGDGAWQALAQLGFAAVDGLAPQIIVLSPDPVVPHRSPALLAADILDRHSRVTTAAYRIDGSGWRPLGAQGSRYEAVLAGLADGEHEIFVRAEDIWGNERIAAPFRFVADSTPPQIVFDGVSDGQTSNQPLAPQVSVIDAHPDRLSVWLDGEPFASGDSIAADGTYTLTALAIDAAGNRSDAALNFTLDTTPPPVAIVDPLDGTTVPDASIAVRVQTEAQAQVTLSVGAWQSGRTADAAGIAIFDTAPLAPGDNLLSAIAQDAVGNTSAPAQITVRRFHIDGELTGSALPASAEVARGTALDATATLANGTAQDHAALPLRVRVLGASGTLDTHAASVALAPGGSLSHPFAFATAGWPLGGITLELAVFLDGAWQVLDSATVAIVDREPPTLTPLAPADGALSRTPVALRALAEDDDAVASVAASIDGGTWLPLATAEAGHWQGDTAPADGPHQVRFRAVDAAGNETVSAPVAFTIDTTPPQIVVTGIADGGLYGEAVQAQVEVLDANPGTLTLMLNGVPYVNGTPIDATGTYLFEAEAEDAVGLTTTRTLRFELDLEPPFVSIDTPADGTILLTTMTPLGGSTRPFASVTVTGDASTHTVTANADGHYGVDAIDLHEGANTLRAVATDRLGRISPETTITVYRSATALGLDGQLSATPAQLPIGTALDLAYRIDERLGIARTALPMRLLVQRAGGKVTVFEQVATVDLVADWHVEGTAAAASTDWNPGAHIAELAVEVDGAWHTLAASGIDVLDATPPQVAFVEPAIDSYHATAAAVEVTASDAHSTVATVEARVGTGAWIALSQAKPGQPWTGNLPSPGDGPATLQARAADTAGNLSAVAERPIVFDATPPRIAISGVADGELRNAPVTPVVAVEDASPMHAALTLDGLPWVSGTIVADDGMHLLRVVAVDAAGNRSEASVRFTIDTTPPAVVLTSPADGGILRSPAVDVAGVTEPGAVVELSAAGKTYAAQADAMGAFLVPRVALALGHNEIAARATDAAGNLGDHARITVERRGEPLLRGELDAPATHDRLLPLPLGIGLHNEADEPIAALPIRVVARLSDGQVVELDARQLALEPRAGTAYTLHAPTQGWPPGNAVLQLLAAPDPAAPGTEVQLAAATVAITGGPPPRITPIPTGDARWLALLALLLAGIAIPRVLRREGGPC